MSKILRCNFLRQHIFLTVVFPRKVDAGTRDLCRRDRRRCKQAAVVHIGWYDLFQTQASTRRTTNCNQQPAIRNQRPWTWDLESKVLVEMSAAIRPTERVELPRRKDVEMQENCARPPRTSRTIEVALLQPFSRHLFDKVV